MIATTVRELETPAPRSIAALALRVLLARSWVEPAAHPWVEPRDAETAGASASAIPPLDPSIDRRPTHGTP